MKHKHAPRNKALLGPRQPKQQPSTGKLPSLKHQIRGFERLLKKEDLDPKVRSAKEQQLRQLQQKQAERQKAERERKFAVKYHKIRFFERVKVERHIQKVKRVLQQKQQQTQQPPSDQAAAANEEQQHLQQQQLQALSVEQLQEQLQQLEQDLQYVLHFPKGERYVSLFKQAETLEAQQQLDARRLRLRQLVLLQLQEAAAIAEADEGATIAATGAAMLQKHIAPAVGGPAVPKLGKQPAQAAADEDMISDGDDFFLQSGSEDGLDEEQETGQGRVAAASDVKGKQAGQLLGQQQQQRRHAVVQQRKGAEAVVRKASSLQQARPELQPAAAHTAALQTASAGTMDGLVIGRGASGHISAEGQHNGDDNEASILKTGSDEGSDDTSEQGAADESDMDIGTWLEQQRKKAAPLLAGGTLQQQQQQQQQVEQPAKRQRKQQGTDANLSARGDEEHTGGPVSSDHPIHKGNQQQQQQVRQPRQQQQDKQPHKQSHKPRQQQQQQQGQQRLRQPGRQHTPQQWQQDRKPFAARGKPVEGNAADDFKPANDGSSSKPAAAFGSASGKKFVGKQHQQQRRHPNQQAAEKQPLRKRSEGGRKRRKKA